MIMFGSLRSSLSRFMRRATDCTPFTASTTIAHVSTAGSAGIAWPMKSGYPGVSMMFVFFPSCMNCTTAEESECPCSFSSGSKSATVFFSSIVPMRPITPASWSSRSSKVVLPQPACPTKAMLRMSAV